MKLVNSVLMAVCTVYRACYASHPEESVHYMSANPITT